MGPNFLLHQPVQNKILAGLPEDELTQIRPHLTRLRLVSEQVLIDHGQRTEHAFFVEEGIVSLVADGHRSRSSIQVAMIGREGLIGCQSLLGVDTGACVSAVTQTPGPALRIPVGELRRLAGECPVLRRLCMEAMEALMHQIMQTAASNARNTLAERCVRWLLMAHDRIDGNDLPITHEALSSMLGVRRSGITVVASGLQDAGLIRVGRGRITIVDRAGLEDQAERVARPIPYMSTTMPGRSPMFNGSAATPRHEAMPA